MPNYRPDRDESNGAGPCCSQDRPKCRLYKPFNIIDNSGPSPELSTCTVPGLYRRSKPRSFRPWCWVWPAPQHGPQPSAEAGSRDCPATIPGSPRNGPHGLRKSLHPTAPRWNCRTHMQHIDSRKPAVEPGSCPLSCASRSTLRTRLVPGESLSGFRLNTSQPSTTYS